MGSSKAGTWIIGILIYYVLFFLILTLIVNGKTEMLGSSDPNIRYTDPGFVDRYKPNSQACVGVGDVNYFAGTILCSNLDGLNNVTCPKIKDCEWKNATSIFDITIIRSGCENEVNTTYYGITGSDYCKASGLQNRDMCRTFKCNWVNTSDISSQQQDTITKNSMASIFEVIGWVLVFDVNLGLGSFTWIFSILFFYVEFVCLLIAIYYSIPFIHGG